MSGRVPGWNVSASVIGVLSFPRKGKFMASVVVKIALAVAIAGLFLYPVKKLREGIVVIGIVIVAAFVLHFVHP
jgi:hypothetical protein